MVALPGGPGGKMFGPLSLWGRLDGVGIRVSGQKDRWCHGLG